MSLRDYFRSDSLTLQGSVRLLTSLAETIVAMQEMGLVHGGIDSTKVYVDWESHNDEMVSLQVNLFLNYRYSKNGCISYGRSQWLVQGAPNRIPHPQFE